MFGQAAEYVPDGHLVKRNDYLFDQAAALHRQAEFAPIKSRFARGYLEYKADLGVPDATDEAMLEHVDDMTALMLGALGRAMAEHRHTWLQHYGWFTDLVIELLEEEPGKPLDG